MTRRAKLCLDFARKQQLMQHVVEEMLRWGLVLVVDTYRSRMGSTELRPELRWAEGLTKEEALAAYQTLKQLRAQHRMQQCRDTVRKIEQASRCFSVSLAPAVKQAAAAMGGVLQAFEKIKLPQPHIVVE